MVKGFLNDIGLKIRRMIKRVKITAKLRLAWCKTAQKFRELEWKSFYFSDECFVRAVKNGI
jgi:hypothetical protein